MYKSGSPEVQRQAYCRRGTGVASVMGKTQAPMIWGCQALGRSWTSKISCLHALSLCSRRNREFGGLIDIFHI